MTQLSIPGAITLILGSEILIAGTAIWLDEFAGGLPALIFTMGGAWLWLKMLPDIVSATEAI
ncbi:MAG: hypothetical protein AB7V40_05915 [Methyloceanibacter sp.]